MLLENFHPEGYLKALAVEFLQRGGILMNMPPFAKIQRRGFETA